MKGCGFLKKRIWIMWIIVTKNSTDITKSSPIIHIIHILFQKLFRYSPKAFHFPGEILNQLLELKYTPINPVISLTVKAPSPSISQTETG